jgi:hypothetical protein
VTLLDYGAGNVRSVRNAIKKLGYTIKDVSSCCVMCRSSTRCCSSQRLGFFITADAAGVKLLQQLGPASR